MSELDFEDRITTTLGRMADRVPASAGDVPDIRRRVVGRRRSLTVGLCTVFVVAAIATFVAAEYGSDFTPTQQPLATVTSPVTTPQAFVPLWPGVLPDGVTFVEGFGLEVGPGSYGTGLLARLDDAEHVTAVWIRAEPGALVADPSGSPLALPDGREAYVDQIDDRATLVYVVGNFLVSLSGTVPIDDLVSAAGGIFVSADGVVTPRQGADGVWQVVIPPSSLEGPVEYRAIFELGGERFAVASSPSPPSIDNPIQQSGPLTVEHTDEGDLWHLAAVSFGQRADGTWVLIGSAEPPGLPLDERRAILASLQAATPDQRAMFSADGDIGGQPDMPDMPCRLDALDDSGHYIVQVGDYLNGIASCFGITLEALLEANPDWKFLVGSKLVIPTTTTATTLRP